MDLAQSARQLQAMQGYGPAPQVSCLPGTAPLYMPAGQEPFAGVLGAAHAGSAASALNNMDLRLVQGGGLSRSRTLDNLRPPAVVEAQLQASSGLSASAQLAGTVAALQEESRQSRSQWKSDVARLERELGQLRAAAAWALPHLAEAQQKHEALTFTGSQQQGLMLHASASEQALPLLQAQQTIAMAQEQNAAEARMNALRREAAHITEALGHATLPQGNGRETAQLTEALLRQLRATAAAEAAARAPEPIQPTLEQTIASVASVQSQEPSAMQLTEAVLAAHIRAANANAPESGTMGPIHEAEGPLEAALRNHRFSAATGASPQAAPKSTSRLDNLCVTAPPTQREAAPAREREVAPASPPQVPLLSFAPSPAAEMFQELERLDLELQKVRDENRKLKDEKDVCEAAHARDVSALEAMLAQVVEENKSLSKALSERHSAPPSNQVGGIGGSFDAKFLSIKNQAPMTPHSMRSEVEPAIEPEIERSGKIDRWWS